MQDNNGRWNKSVGNGLFAKVNLSKNDIVAQFVGEIVTFDEFQRRDSGENCRYGIEMKKGVVLDCFDAATKGLCLASMANSPYKVMKWDSIEQCWQKPIANCKLCICSQTMSVRLRAKTNIARGEELCYNYGNLFSLY